MPISPEQRKEAKKAIKNVEFQLNPEKAVHEELLEQTGHLDGIKEGLEALKYPISKGNSAGEFLAMFLRAIKGDKGDQGEKGEDGTDGKTPKKGVDYFTAEEIQKLSTDILRLATPKKGEDYFTDEEKQEIIDATAKIAAEMARPIKGVDYDDGKDGINGTNGKNGEPGKDAVLPDIAQLASLVIDTIRKEKRLLLSDLRDGGAVKYNKKDQRWHGGGPTLDAGTNITIVTNADGTTTISATGGAGLNPQVPVGAIDSSNTTYTYTGTLNALYLNGIFQTPTTDYSVAGQTITMVYPPSTGSTLFSL